MGRMPWPKLYRITLRAIDHRERTYTVLSWIGEHKAVAMAVEVHTGFDSGRLRKTWPVYDVAVQDLGWAPKNDDGTVGEGPPGYLEDRAEF